MLKKVLLISLVTFILGCNPRNNEISMMNEVLRKIGNCLEDAKIELVQEPVEIFESCSQYTDDIDEIKSCIESESYEFKTTIAEEFYFCEKVSLEDHYREEEYRAEANTPD